MAEIEESKAARAGQRVKLYMLASLGVGLVPLPLVDTALLSGLQLKMLHSLANLYGVDFYSQLGKSLIASLLGGGVPVSLSVNLARLIKGIPLYGQIVGIVGTSFFGGASTYAVGKVFIQHFESGGTFLTFDPPLVREYFAEQLIVGQEEAQQSFIGEKP